MAAVAADTAPPPAKPILRPAEIKDHIRAIQLTDHATQRAEERGVGVMEIYSALAQPDRVLESKYEGSDVLLHHRGDVVVALNPVRRTIVTVIDPYENVRLFPRTPQKPHNTAGLEAPTAEFVRWATTPQTIPASRPTLVTPAFAKKLLDREPTGELRSAVGMRNRKTREPEVDFHCSLLKAGEFVLTNDAAALDSSGWLLDCKHRLLAIVRSGIPAPLFITVGLPPEAYAVIGTGRRRTPGDVVYMHGQDKDAVLTASVARLIILFKDTGALDAANNTRRRPRVTNVKVITQIDADPQLMADSIRMGKTLTRASDLLTSAGATGYYLIREACRQHPLVDPFFEHLESGAQLDRNDPRKLLRDLCGHSKGARYRDNTKHLALLLKAWNAHATGREIRSLAWRGDERMPGVFVPPPVDDRPKAEVVVLPSRAARVATANSKTRARVA